jgi:hypothetical protein
LTDSGEVAVEVPRDRDGSFEPVIVAKRQRRLSSIDEIVLSLYARGLPTGDIAAQLRNRGVVDVFSAIRKERSMTSPGCCAQAVVPCCWTPITEPGSSLILILTC